MYVLAIKRQVNTRHIIYTYTICEWMCVCSAHPIGRIEHSARIPQGIVHRTPQSWASTMVGRAISAPGGSSGSGPRVRASQVAGP